MRLHRPASFLRGWSARAVSVSLAAILVAAAAFLALRPAVRAQHAPPVSRAGGEVTPPRLLLKVEPQWQFQPGYLDGQPVAVSATIEVNFRLR